MTREDIYALCEEKLGCPPFEYQVDLVERLIRAEEAGEKIALLSTPLTGKNTIWEMWKAAREVNRDADDAGTEAEQELDSNRCDHGSHSNDPHVRGEGQGSRDRRLPDARLRVMGPAVGAEGRASDQDSNAGDPNSGGGRPDELQPHTGQARDLQQG